jgi:RHS repeat-associated protein
VVGDAPVNATPALLLTPAPNETWKVYYYAGAQLMAMRVLTGTTGNTLYYLHSDHLGSTSVTTSITGTVLARQDYTPYGSVRSGGGLPTDIGFTGQRAESGLGSLMYFRARFYSPYLNRWLQPDSIVPEPGNPQALNRYAFVYNNPLKYIDPSGHCSDDPDEPTGCLQLGQQIQEEFGVSIEDLGNDLWTVSTLRLLYSGLFSFRKAIGKEAYYKYFPKGVITIAISPAEANRGSYWEKNVVGISENVFDEGIEFVGTVVHEMSHGLAVRTGTELEAVEKFAIDTGWQTVGNRRRCVLLVFDCHDVPIIIRANPEDGPTPYARGEIQPVDAKEDAAETFTALAVPGFGDRPVTRERREWFGWWIDRVEP